MKKPLFSLSFALFVSTFIFAQTGPGGVGNQLSNVIWLAADDITGLADGDDISTWTDVSGNGNTVSQGTTALQPIYKTGILNGLPVVRFNKTNGRIRKTGFTGFPTTNITAIYVNANSESSDGVLSYASSGGNNDFLLFNSNNLGVYRGTPVNSGVALNDSYFHIVNAAWRNSDGRVQVWKDGSVNYTTTGHRTGTSITTGGSLAIAGEQDSQDGGYDASQAHFGDYSEVMIFNTYLNNAQHIIVANYLAAKYFLTISNDRYAHKTNHPHDVAGIGREDPTSIHSAAMSADILQVENPSGLNLDQEYLLFGHDDGDVITSWTTTESPNAGVDIQRLAREWRVDETGDIGTVDFVVDVAQFPSLPAGHTMYSLMIDADGDFSSGASVYELTLISGTEYTVTGLNIADGDYIALAAVNPTVQHTVLTSNGFEPNNASINITLNFIPSTTKSVDFSTTDGSALSSAPDYTSATSSTLSFSPGSATANYTVLITNDAVVENDETFTISLSNPSTGLSIGTNINHTFTIKDEDNARKIYFNAATSSDIESNTNVSVSLAINNVDVVNPTTVDYSITDGTAIGGGVDYTLALGTVTIPAGSSTASINFTVNDDALFENDETLVIEMSNPTNCNLDGIAPFGGTSFIEHTYTITDDDVMPALSFNPVSNSGSESVSAASFPVEINTASGAEVSFSYTISGTAISGVDFTLASATVTIPAGSLSTNISASIINDINEELSETIILTIASTVNATIGGDNTSTYTIIDNDNFGHLGPGGVGQSDNNKLWVKSGDLSVVADGTDISSWTDASGNGRDLTQTNASFKPRYFANVVNGNAVARFNQSNGRLIHNSYSDFPTTNITTYFVNSNTDAGDGLISYASSGSTNDYLLFNSGNLNFFRGAGTGSGVSINGGTMRIIGNSWQASDGVFKVYRNGSLSYTGTHATGTSITGNGCLAIGGEQDAIDGGYAASQSHQGDFAEIIIYNVVLNSARHKIINNYLSAKYNRTISNDMFAYDTPGNYEYEVAGIGRDDINNFHADAQGSAMVRVNTASSMDDGDYLIWGHDNASLLNANTTDVPFGVQNRMERVWRVDKTGDVGSVTIDFDIAGFTIDSGSDIVLLIDGDDGNFTNASSFAVTSVAGNIATFETIGFTDGNWFTLGSLSSNSVLPIELISFEAVTSDQSVLLNWITATETHNDFFTVERSIDATNWEEILTVNGAGNSIQEIKYNEVDYTPISGVSYYRLKQTDFDGNYTYSNIISVNFQQLSSENLLVYPNPTDNIVTIEGSAFELQEFFIFNMLGQEITERINILESSKTKIIIDFSDLNSGMYEIKTKTTTHKVYKN